jgi:regulator of sirC expression with transglutaminase-like and TPR domain
MGPEETLKALEAIGDQADETIDLGEAALLLAALEMPDADLAPYRRHLAQLASDLADIAPAGPETLETQAEALQSVMVAQHGYLGDAANYDDIANANLIRVIDRRRGLPVALGILYLHAARAQGWRSFGINFPGHFLVTIESEDERVILDPFEQGAAVDVAELRRMLQRALGVDAALEPEHYASMTNRGVLLRLQNNIKKRLRDAGDSDHAGRVLDSMLAIAPDVADLWREAAELRAETGNLRSALQAVDRFLLLSPDSDRADALALRRQLATRIN